MANNLHSSIIIRRAAGRDNSLLAAVGAETFVDSFGADNTPEDVAAHLNATFSPEKQAAELADSNSRFFIAEAQGEAAGYAKLNFGEEPIVIAPKKSVEIVRFYARKQWIGRGVGSKLMAACLDEARMAGCDLIWLGVWEQNPRAIAFYTKWGFVEVGAQTFRLGSDLQRDLVMVRAVA